MYRLKYKIWLDNKGVVFGTGLDILLRGVQTYGSLSKAVQEMNMSYNKAHKLIKRVEERVGFKLLKSKIGGTGGGFSQLTDEALELMATYESFYDECQIALNNIYDKYFKC